MARQASHPTRVSQYDAQCYLGLWKLSRRCSTIDSSCTFQRHLHGPLSIAFEWKIEVFIANMIVFDLKSVEVIRFARFATALHPLFSEHICVELDGTVCVSSLDRHCHVVLAPHGLFFRVAFPVSVGKRVMASPVTHDLSFFSSRLGTRLTAIWVITCDRIQTRPLRHHRHCCVRSSTSRRVSCMRSARRRCRPRGATLCCWPDARRVRWCR